MHVLATKGHVKFVRGNAAADLGLARERSKYGFLCVKQMLLKTDLESVDPQTGEIVPLLKRVLPSDFMCPETGAMLPVENPEVWIDEDGVCA